MGDGHCLFRALSKAVTGTQNNHVPLCLAITNFMIHKDNAINFAKYLFEPDFSSQKEAVLALEQYINGSKMRENGWGTIIVAATLFQVEINVYAMCI